MKISSTLYLTLFGTMLCVSSCKKQTTGNDQTVARVPRKIQFLLYTSSDFSTYHRQITFILSIRKPNSEVLWDTVLPPMKIKDIPGASNKIVIEKLVPANEQGLLKVGFIYSIEHVGISWYWEQSREGEPFKKVEFNFR